MNLSIFTRYTSLGASSRLRYFAYLDGLIKNGINVDVDSFLPHSYLVDLYAKRQPKILPILRAYAKRIHAVLNTGDNLLIEYELLPFAPYWLEKRLIGSRRYVLNFDDNVWCNYVGKRLLADKYDKLVKHAAGVIVANDYLYEKTRHLNTNIIKIPTAVELRGYEGSYEKYKNPTIVWIGTPVTFAFLEAFAEVFERLSEQVEYDLLVVASSSLKSGKFKKTKIRFVDWTADGEAEWLIRSHVGVMPLTSDDFAAGKSAYKIIQYFAVGLPVVASAVGENKNVVRQGVNGFLAETPEAFGESLRKLLIDKSLYADLALSARMTSQEFSLERQIPVYVEFLKKSLC